MNALRRPDHATPAPEPTPRSAPKVRNLDIAGLSGRIPLRIYQPGADALLPLVLYFHGGGFVGGSLDDADSAARHLAQHVPAVVVSVAYALAPTRPFPAATEDAYAAAAWAASHAETLGASASRIVVAGDDAGGNLAATLALIARDRQDFRIAIQVLIGPMLDPSMTRLGDAARLQADLGPDVCASRYRSYLPKLSQRLHPYAAPLESCRQAGLPAAYIATAEHDVLRNEAECYGAALIAGGVHTQVERFPGINHSALLGHPPVLENIVRFLQCRLAAHRFIPPSSTSPTF
jgi:acetyl esterase